MLYLFRRSPGPSNSGAQGLSWRPFEIRQGTARRGQPRTAALRQKSFRVLGAVSSGSTKWRRKASFASLVQGLSHIV
jgi:hypothetical protein